MTDVSKQLLDAIRAYTDEYGSDDKYSDVVKELKATAVALEDHKPDGEDTPGKDQTRRAIQAAREKPAEPKEPKPEAKAEDGPKSFKEARESAMKRMSEPAEEGSESEGAEAPVAA